MTDENELKSILRRLDAEPAPAPAGLPKSLPATFGDYELLSEIGRGGMGVVYQARQRSLDRRVAVKVLLPREHGSEILDTARFRREAEALALLEHPNIVRIYDFGFEGDLPFFSMEWIDGQTLDRVLHRHLSARDDLIRIVATVARALDFAHRKGIVHRDVKPSNILVDAAGAARLADFGLAQTGGERLTQSGAMLGTPVYMSPEQVRGVGIDARSDIYSLGGVLYEALTGRPPSLGATIESILQRILAEEPVPPRAIEPGIAIDVETACLKALAKDPADRYATAGEFADDLERILRGESIVAKRPGVVARARTWVRRHRMAAGVAVAAILGVAVAITATKILTERRFARELAVREDAAEAERLFERGDYAGALARYGRLSGTPETRLRAGICLSLLGRHDEAEAALAASTRERPHDAAAWRYRALNAFARSDIATAVQAYGRAAELLKLTPSDELDVVAAQIEQHFLREEPRRARPAMAEYDPTYLFWDRPTGATPRGVSGAWKERFPARPLARLSVPDLDRRIAAEPHPVLLGWRAQHAAHPAEQALADVDRALAEVPISRWLRYRRATLLLKLGRKSECDRERAALGLLCPREPGLRLQMAHMLKDLGEHREAASEFERLFDDLQAGSLGERWEPAGRPPVDYLPWYAATCLGKAGDAAGAVRLLRRVKPAPSRARVRGAPEFKDLLGRPEFAAFLEELAP